MDYYDQLLRETNARTGGIQSNYKIYSDNYNAFLAADAAWTSNLDLFIKTELNRPTKESSSVSSSRSSGGSIGGSVIGTGGSGSANMSQSDSTSYSSDYTERDINKLRSWASKNPKPIWRPKENQSWNK